MGDLGDVLRDIWQSLFTLPERTKAGDAWKDGGWGWFGSMWLWAISGAIPGALAAAYIIGQFHISDQRLQDAVSVGLAFVSMLLIQVIALLAAFGWAGPIVESQLYGGDRVRKILEAGEQDAQAGKLDTPAVKQALEVMDEVLHNPLPPRLVTLSKVVLMPIFYVAPFVLAGGAIYWYFTHASASSGVAARGASGALALKVLLTLINVVVWPAVKAVFLKGLWQWMRGNTARTSKPDEPVPLD